MSWEALWRAPASLQVRSTAVNPQGSLAAPVGTIAVRSCDGTVYVKRGGGSTAYGWYILGSDQFMNWLPKWLNGAANMTINHNQQGLALGPSTIINALPQLSAPGVGSASAKRLYVGGYNSGGAGNSFLYRLTTNTDNMPVQRLDNDLATNFLEFDCWWDILTTPRSNSGATSTDLTTGTMRIWAGGVFGSSNVQAVGGTVDSDTLATEWPTALSGADGLFGWAWRFSSAVDAGIWQLVTTRRSGGAYAQTVTPFSLAGANGAVTANTAYRLRVRYIFVAGVLTAFGSINDGIEIAVTGNVAPVAPFTVAQSQPFQPLASVRATTATLKSLAVAQCAMNYGTGVGVTC